MPLNNYQKICYRWFGKSAELLASEKLEGNLEKAHIDIRPGAYVAYVWVNTILACAISILFYIMLVVLIPMSLTLIITLALIPIFATLTVYFFYMHYPVSKAKSRAKKIDLNLSYALNFISAMSSAGITPTEIFRSLSKQNIYGEVKEEALWIYRDITLLGNDIITSIKANIKRTPSEKFKEFLQGVIITVQSGGALKPYFMNKAEQYTRENRITQKQLIESLGIMAEAYVTTAISGVLLLIIIIPLLMIISSAGVEQLTFMYIFVFVVCPLIHIGFSVVLTGMCEKV